MGELSNIAVLSWRGREVTLTPTLSQGERELCKGLSRGRGNLGAARGYLALYNIHDGLGQGDWVVADVYSR